VTPTVPAWHEHEGLCTALAGPGWGVQLGFLAADLVRGLVTDIGTRDADGAFRPAAVGAGAARAVRPGIRGDRISWLVTPATPAEHAVLARLEGLRVALNATLKLGLTELECHYAIYAPGAHYARHLDRSPRGVERAVSVILYLNEAWDGADGGELVLSTDTGDVCIEPRAGTLAVFLSERFEHEVRVARRARLSLTGWFRRRPLGGPAL
jgi:SM-20-related protein